VREAFRNTRYIIAKSMGGDGRCEELHEMRAKKRGEGGVCWKIIIDGRGDLGDKKVTTQKRV